MLECIKRISNADSDYLKNIIDRNTYMEIIIEVKFLYKNLLFDQNFSDSKYYKLFLVLLLKKSYQCLLFEDTLLNSVILNINKYEDKISVLADEMNIICTSLFDTKTNSKPISKAITNQIVKTTKRSNYPQKVLKVFKQWLKDHMSNPYPSEYEKQEFCEITGLDIAQINNWFINARRRLVPRKMKKKFN